MVGPPEAADDEEADGEPDERAQVEGQLPGQPVQRFAVAVEGSSVAIEYARRNVPSNVELVHAPVEEYAYRMPAADLVFLDPPRSGARHNVIDAVAKKARSMICFLACDPVTFARDASRLTASGWRLSTLDLLDLFPNTHHVETLASFERAS